MKLSSNLGCRRLKCVTLSHFYTICRETERFQRSPQVGYGKERCNSNGFCGRAPRSSFHDTRLQALQVSTGTRVQKCGTINKSKTPGSLNVAVSHFCTICSKKERFHCTPQCGYGKERWNSNGLCGRALGSTCHNNFTLLQALQV